MQSPRASWHQAFIESYLNDLPQEATLTARPGEGKTFAAVNLWNRLLKDYDYQHLIVIIPSLALRDHWQYMLQQHMPPTLLLKNLHVHIQSLLYWFETACQRTAFIHILVIFSTLTLQHFS
jgi:hypothetical protein